MKAVTPRILVTIIFSLMLMSSCVKQGEYDFAIISDKESYEAAREEIEMYAGVLNSEGLKTIIVVDIWNHPDSIREELMRLHSDNPLFEGVVFIGEIPIPMLRDAQHMTSAFKMDQDRYPWGRSSVASDRFYEDFDLSFDYLMQDSVQPLYHYYSLRHDSPQKLSPEIYSGRIRIPWDDDKSVLKSYLTKVVEAHKSPQKVSDVLMYSGHGYNSESMTARIDERSALLQQFPQLWGQKNRFDYINFDFDTHVKHRLLATMSSKDIDIAFLHHHGSATAQYVSGENPSKGVQANIESVKNYLRSKVRPDKDPEAAIKRYMEWLDVPRSWFDLTFDQEQSVKDSLFFRDMDIMANDLEKYFPRVSFIIFDACFNGSYYVDDYISGRYVFGNSKTITAQGNTVNAIQDKFPDEMAGLLSLGMRVGEWNKNVCSLETHIIGDPTFRFSNIMDLNFGKLKKAEGNTRKLLRYVDYPHPDVQAWALRQLYNSGYSDLGRLLHDKYLSSDYFVTRMECLKILSFIRDDNFVKVTTAAMSDSYELIRRLGANYAWKSGHPDLVDPLIKAYANPNTSKRENYQLRDGLGFFDKDLMTASLNRWAEGYDTTGNHFGKTYQVILRDISSLTASSQRTISEIVLPETTQRDRIFSIRNLRNKTYHTGVSDLTDYLMQCDDEDMQWFLLEALGWFEYSYRRGEIIDVCQSIAGSAEYSERIRNEATKTINRLK
ncbi:MAG: HEAT repeat domain-containing protein [Bacteroidales bacterium]